MGVTHEDHRYRIGGGHAAGLGVAYGALHVSERRAGVVVHGEQNADRLAVHMPAMNQ